MVQVNSVRLFLVSFICSLQERANEGTSLRQIAKPPLFGGNLDFSHHCLSESGKSCCHYVLAAIDMSRPDLHHFSPQIPNLVSLALLFMSSDDVCKLSCYLSPCSIWIDCISAGIFADCLTSCTDVPRGQGNVLDKVLLDSLQSMPFVMRAVDLKLKACTTAT